MVMNSSPAASFLVGKAPALGATTDIMVGMLVGNRGPLLILYMSRRCDSGERRCCGVIEGGNEVAARAAMAYHWDIYTHIHLGHSRRRQENVFMPAQKREFQCHLPFFLCFQIDC